MTKKKGRVPEFRYRGVSIYPEEHRYFIISFEGMHRYFSCLERATDFIDGFIGAQHAH